MNRFLLLQSSSFPSSFAVSSPVVAARALPLPSSSSTSFSPANAASTTSRSRVPSVSPPFFPNCAAVSRALTSSASYHNTCHQHRTSSDCSTSLSSFSFLYFPSCQKAAVLLPFSAATPTPFSYLSLPFCGCSHGTMALGAPQRVLSLAPTTATTATATSLSTAFRPFFHVSAAASCSFSTAQSIPSVPSRGDIVNKIQCLCQKYLEQTDPTSATPIPPTASSSSAVMDNSQSLESLMMHGNRQWDCLDTVEFLLDVETLFNISIPDETADNIKTLQEVIDFVQKELEEKSTV